MANLNHPLEEFFWKILRGLRSSLRASMSIGLHICDSVRSSCAQFGSAAAKTIT
jgi:hypothetical protein